MSSTTDVGRRRWAWRFLLANGRPAASRLALAALLGALATSSSVALTATSAWLISRAAQHPPVLTLMVATVAVRTFGISRGVLRYLERLVAHDATLRILARLRVRLFAALVPLMPAGIGVDRGGDLTSRLVSDVEAVQDAYVRAFVPIVVAVLSGAAAVVFTAVLLPAAALTLLAALLLGGLAVPWVVVLADRRAATTTAAARGELAGEIVDFVAGATDLAAFSATAERIERLDRAGGRLARLERSGATSLALGTGLSSLAAGFALWAAFLVAIPAVRAGALSGVLLAVVVLLAWAAPDVVADLPAVGLHLVRARAAAVRVLDLTTRPIPVPGDVDEAASEVPVDTPLAAAPVVQLRGVCARYQGDRPRVLHGVDLQLEPGRRVVVTGESGAGKSTLVDVLLRFLDIETGEFLLGGLDARTLRGTDVRRIIGCCEQQPHLFDSTMRANLLVGRPDADEAELREVLRRVRLDEWVASLPAGLDTLVGENGTQVSGGQARRIALARALLADTPILLLDEPTEGLDDEIATALLADALAATRERGVLLVTHRLLGIEDADQVMVLEQGRLVAREPEPVSG